MAQPAARRLPALAEVFHALSDPTRLQVVELLRDGEQCVCDLTERVKASQSRLSFHLKILKEAGLLKDRRDGRWVYYALDTDLLNELAACLRDVTVKAGKTSDCCG